MGLANSDEGDPFLDPEMIDYIYKAALFVAAVVKATKNSYDLWKTFASDVKKRDPRFSELPDDVSEKLAKKATENKKAADTEERSRR